MQAVASVMGFDNFAPEKQFFGDLLRFGDLRCFSMDKIFEYFRMNEQQVASVRWIENNLLSYYAERNKVEVNLLKGAVSLHRIGMIPGQEMLILSALVMRIDAPIMKPLESRQISIGVKGGRRLLNAFHDRNTVVGEWVLKAAVK